MKTAVTIAVPFSEYGRFCDSSRPWMRRWTVHDAESIAVLTADMAGQEPNGYGDGGEEAHGRSGETMRPVYS